MTQIEEYKAQIEQILQDQKKQNSSRYDLASNQFFSRKELIQREMDGETSGAISQWLIEHFPSVYEAQKEEPFPDFLLRFIGEGLQGHVFGNRYVEEYQSLPCGCWQGNRTHLQQNDGKEIELVMYDWIGAIRSNAVRLWMESDITYTPIERWLLLCADHADTYRLPLNLQTNIWFALFLNYLVEQYELQVA